MDKRLQVHIPCNQRCWSGKLIGFDCGRGKNSYMFEPNYPIIHLYHLLIELDCDYVTLVVLGYSKPAFSFAMQACRINNCYAYTP